MMLVQDYQCLYSGPNTYSYQIGADLHPPNNYWVPFYCTSLLIISLERLLDVVCAQVTMGILGFN